MEQARVYNIAFAFTDHDIDVFDPNRHFIIR